MVVAWTVCLCGAEKLMACAMGGVRMAAHEPLPVCSVRDARKGFSLVELLVVISIIVIILTFTIPATTGLFRGSLLTQGSQMLGDQFALARQMALTRNHPVELRFFKFSDPEVPGEGTDIEGESIVHSSASRCCTMGFMCQ